MENLIKAHLLKADLIEIDSELKADGIQDMKSIILIKHLLITISNLVDFEASQRRLYKENQELSALFKDVRPLYDFAKYLRNKFVGHIKPELLEKAIEWRPELRYMLSRLNERDVMVVYNLYILETAINSYVDSNGKHKVFRNETDLNYPPDLEKFGHFLQSLIVGSLSYLEALVAVLSERVEFLSPQEQNIEHWIKAGETEFSFIKK
nr:hypothetical protein [uncultured Vibrio sp.]